MDKFDKVRRRRRRWLMLRGGWRFRIVGGTASESGAISYVATFLSHGQY